MGLFASCKKPYERSCLKTKGDETTATLHFTGTIDSLKLFDNLVYTLVQSSQKAGTIELSGGKNLLPFVKVSEENNNLILHNKNKCNFLRSYKNRIYATIYVDSIASIYYEGTRSLKTKGVLHTNQLHLTMKEGNGSADLQVDCNLIAASVTNGVGNFKLSGQANSTHIYCRSNSYCDIRELHTANSLFVNSTTAGAMKINADHVALDVEIYRNGDIQYIGTPLSIQLDREGSGKLIKID